MPRRVPGPQISAGQGAGRIVLCMKWGRLFSPDYVNVLFNACRRNLPGPFRFICLTEDAQGFVAGIEVLPLPDLGLEPQDWYTKGVWPKLGLFLRDLHGLSGRCLFIDLDMVIAGPLDDFFTQPGRFISTDMGAGWRPQGSRAGGGRAGGGRLADAAPETGTCLFAFDIGAEAHVAESFLRDPRAVMAKFHNEQDYVGAMVRPMAFWPRGWVISFKRFLRRPVGIDLFLAPHAPPPGAKVVAFHGDPRPADLLRPGRGRWDRFPHMGHGQVRWMAEYWTAHGGRLP